MKKIKILFFILFLLNKNSFFMPGGVPRMEDPMGDFPPPPPMPVEVPVDQQIPVTVSVEQPVVPTQFTEQQPALMETQGQVSPVPVVAQQPMPAFSPAPAIPAGPPVTESQIPLVEVADGKPINLSESTGPLVQVSNVQEMKIILEQAKLIMQDIKNILSEIENIGKEFETKFENIDKQLDLLYQTIGFERGVQTEKLSAG